MKVFLALLFSALISLSFQINAARTNKTGLTKQSDPFKIYVFPDRFGSSAKAFFEQNKVSVATLQTQGAIVHKGGDSVDSVKVARFLEARFPGKNSTGVVVLDWESGPYKKMMKLNASERDFQASEQEYLKLIRLAKKLRPNIKFGIYGIPYRAFNNWQKKNYNPPGKFRNVLKEVDFIAPSLYILYPDEQIGHARNLQYLKDNLDIALLYGKEYNKPVIPFVWHRIHGSNKVYRNNLIPKEVFAQYVDFVASYSFQNNKASGVFWYDYSKRKDQLKGLTNIQVPAAYDSLIVAYTSAILKELK